MVDLAFRPFALSTLLKLIVNTCHGIRIVRICIYVSFCGQKPVDASALRPYFVDNVASHRTHEWYTLLYLRQINPGQWSAVLAHQLPYDTIQNTGAKPDTGIACGALPCVSAASMGAAVAPRNREQSR